MDSSVRRLSRALGIHAYPRNTLSSCKFPKTISSNGEDYSCYFYLSLVLCKTNIASFSASPLTRRLFTAVSEPKYTRSNGHLYVVTLASHSGAATVIAIHEASPCLCLCARAPWVF